MQIKISDGLRGRVVVEGVVDLSSADFSANYSLKGIPPFNLQAFLETFEEEVEVELKAKLVLVLECAYTLEHFDHEVALDEILVFNYKNPKIESENDDIFYEKGPFIDLDPYLYALILSYIPLKVIKPGAKRPESGANYQVLSEEEYSATKTSLGDDFGELLDEIDDIDD